MVSSSKKKRGKQRKAAKTAAVAASSNPLGSIDPNDLTLFHTQNDATFYHPTHHKLAALYVQKGDRKATESMVTLTAGYLPFHEINQPNISLVQSGIVSTVLNFLGRCEHETFNGVMAGAKGHEFTPNGDLIYNVGGNLGSPSTWINILTRSVHLEPSCRLQIAENIGPLVRCMCNDMTRLFFKSNEHWSLGIVGFVDLVGHVLNVSNPNSVDEKAVNALLKHEGLLTSIVQWGFWGEQNRPDISQDLNSIPSIKSMGMEAEIAKLGRSLIRLLLAHAGTLKDEKGNLTGLVKERLQTIGSAPIISKTYDANCMVSYVLSFIRRIKTDGWRDDTDFSNLQFLIDSDCVDKGVMKEVIDLGYACIENTRGYNEYVFVLLSRVSAAMLCSGIEVGVRVQFISDTRTAFAIRTGLIEMSLDILEHYAKHYPSTAVSILDYMWHLFNHIYIVSLHKKSAKAISHKRSSIEEKLVRLEENMNITSNEEYKKLLESARSIISMNGSYCCRCNKPLTRTEVKECNGCHRMAYCSRACQEEDWFNGGHKLACYKSYTDETAGQFQGRYWPRTTPDDERAAAKLEDLEKNITMVQLKLFLENSDTILAQAKGLGIPLYDYIVKFDLCKFPPAVVVARYTIVFDTSESKKGFEETRSKKNITCSYISYMFNGDLNKARKVPHLVMQRLFPHEWLMKKA